MRVRSEGARLVVLLYRSQEDTSPPTPSAPSLRAPAHPSFPRQLRMLAQGPADHAAPNPANHAPATEAPAGADGAAAAAPAAPAAAASSSAAAGAGAPAAGAPPAAARGGYPDLIELDLTGSCMTPGVVISVESLQAACPGLRSLSLDGVGGIYGDASGGRAYIACIGPDVHAARRTRKSSAAAADAGARARRRSACAAQHGFARGALGHPPTLTPAPPQAGARRGPAPAPRPPPAGGACAASSWARPSGRVARPAGLLMTACSCAWRRAPRACKCWA